MEAKYPIYFIQDILGTHVKDHWSDMFIFGTVPKNLFIIFIFILGFQKATHAYLYPYMYA